MPELTAKQWELIDKLNGRRDELSDQQRQLIDKLMQMSGRTQAEPEPAPETISPPEPEPEPLPRPTQQPWAQSADQPISETPFRDIGRYAVGGAETAYRGAMGGLGMILGGVGGAMRLGIEKGSELLGGRQEGEPDAWDKAAQTQAAIMNKPMFNYQPRTETGQEIAPFWERTIAAPTEPLYEKWGQLSDIAAKKAEQTIPGSGKYVGTAAQMAPVIGAMAMGKFAGRKVGKKKYLTAEGATPEFAAALDKHGMKPSDIGPKGKALLDKYNFETPEQAVRAAFMEDQLEGGATRAQITRKKSEMMTQQEFAKTSNKVQGRLEDQNAQLLNKFDLAAESEPRRIGELSSRKTTGVPVSDRIVDRVTATDNKIYDMYKAAEQRSAGKEFISPNKLLQTLNDYRKENDLAGGMITAIEGVMEKNGVIDRKTGQIARKMTATEAENLVQSINKRYKKTGDANKNRIGRILKDALDEDVLKQGGDDLYKQARLEKAKLHRDLRPEKGGKWTKRDVSLTEDILNETVPQNEVLAKGILNNKYRAGEIQQLKKFMHSGTKEQKIQGAKAWRELKAEAMEYIKDNSFGGSGDEKGNRTITRNRFEKAVEKFGDADKLRSFFSAKEIKFLKDMQRTLEIIEPTPGTYIGEGPTAAAINRKLKDLKKRAREFETFKKFENAFYDPESKSIKLPMDSLRKFERAAGAGAGLAAYPGEEEE